MLRIGLLLTTTLLIVLPACTSKKQTATQTAPPGDSSTAPAPNVDYAPEPITGRLANLGLTRDSHWRGLNLGDDFAVIKTKEKEVPFERDARHTGYSLELPDLETADVLYYQTDGKISAIVVDLFLNAQPSVDAYRKALVPYFSTRYGTPKPGADGLVWTGQTAEQISLKDVSKGKDYGLKISIEPVPSGSPTASAN